jgi:hypothetical protein
MASGLVVRCAVVLARNRSRCLLLLVALAGAGCSSSGTPSTSPGTTSLHGAPTTTLSGPVVQSGQQKLPPLYAQGVARMSGGWIFSGTNSLWKTRDDLAEITHTAPSIPAAWAAKGYKHIGDIDIVGKYVYAPFEQPDYSKGFQATARYDVATLRFVDAVTVPQHENSFVTIDPATMTAYSMDHFDGKALTRYDVTHGWKPLAPLPLSRLLHRTQGADVYGGAIWISTDDAQHGIYRVDMKSGAVTQVARMGHAGGEGEGIDATALSTGFLHALCVDRKLVPVWFEHFRA